SARRVGYIVHRVESGDTLASIAEYYTGDRGNWVRLRDYNRHLDAHRIHARDEGKIPAGLLKKRRRPQSTGTRPLRPTPTPRPTPPAPDKLQPGEFDRDAAAAAGAAADDGEADDGDVDAEDAEQGKPAAVAPVAPEPAAEPRAPQSPNPQPHGDDFVL